MVKKILVVDDREDAVAIVRRMLVKEGYEVTSASNGQEGYLKAQEVLPDAILLDMMMPIMDGYTMNRQLKENVKTEHIPVIVISARPPDQTSEFGKDPSARVDGYLVKPVRRETLLMKIEGVFAAGK
jgi:CheY-like chemotaxis protein